MLPIDIILLILQFLPNLKHAYFINRTINQKINTPYFLRSYILKHISPKLLHLYENKVFTNELVKECFMVMYHSLLNKFLQYDIDEFFPPRDYTIVDDQNVSMMIHFQNNDNIYFVIGIS